MSLSPAFLDELRARTSLSSVIGRTTRLIKAGHEFKACCPFHNEKSPSFTVNDDKGFYHCFGCGAHGDAIRWLTDQRGLGFMDAVKELAAEAGMELPAPDPRAAEAAERRDTLYDVMRAAQDWFVANLASDHGAAARAYLAKRGISSETAARFGFGLATDDRAGLKSALSRFPEAMLVEAGLLIEVEGRETYDRFRGRLMLPIEDMRGRVIAFGGRILDGGKTDAPKYLNSPDTPLFDKGATLYNLNRAAATARKAGRLIVVEGYMDVIALAGAGIEECVAPMGTALTERQIDLLWRQVETPILCFDGDAAGGRAAMRAATRALPMLKPGHSLDVVRLPAGLDPDDLVKRDGAAAVEALLGKPISLLDALWSHERDAGALATPEAKAGLKARLMAQVDTIADRDIRALYRRDLLDRFSSYAFPPRDPRAKASRAFGRINPADFAGRDRASPPISDRPEAARKSLCAAIIAGLIRWPEEIARHAETLTSAITYDPRFAMLLDAADHNSPLESDRLSTILAGLGMSLPEAGDYKGFRFGFLLEDCPPDTASNELRHAIGLLVERPALEAALLTATRRLELDLTDEAYAEQQRLLKRKLEFDARLRQMAGALAATAPAGGHGK